MVLNYGEIKSSVPQASGKGHLLFLIYMNDLEKGIKSHIKFFVDDKSLSSIVKDSNTSALGLTLDILGFSGLRKTGGGGGGFSSPSKIFNISALAMPLTTIVK